MEVKIVTEGKERFMDLLLLADEEHMMGKYLDRGTMFTLYDGDLKSVCVVTDEGGGAFEIQNLATCAPCQGKGYGRSLIRYVCDYYKDKGSVMYVGTADSARTVPFYEHSGFTFSHRAENYVAEHYDEPLMENGVQIKDKVYFRRDL